MSSTLPPPKTYFSNLMSRIPLLHFKPFFARPKTTQKPLPTTLWPQRFSRALPTIIKMAHSVPMFSSARPPTPRTPDPKHYGKRKYVPSSAVHSSASETMRKQYDELCPAPSLHLKTSKPQKAICDESMDPAPPCTPSPTLFLPPDNQRATETKTKSTPL